MYSLMQQVAMYNSRYLFLIIMTVALIGVFIFALIKRHQLDVNVLLLLTISFTIFITCLVIILINANYTRNALFEKAKYKTTTISSIESKKEQKDLNIYRVNTWELGRNQLIATKEDLSQGDTIKYKKVGDYIKFDKNHLKVNKLSKKRLMTFDYKYENINDTVNQIVDFKANDAFEKKPKISIEFFDKNNKKLDTIEHVEEQFTLIKKDNENLLQFNKKDYNKEIFEYFYTAKISNIEENYKIDSFKIKLKM